MSPSGLVITRLVKPGPASLVMVATVLAPTRRSVALAVTTDPLLLLALSPAAAALVSTGFTESMPLYSRMRTSGKAAAGEKLTVTGLPPAAAPAIFLA